VVAQFGRIPGCTATKKSSSHAKTQRRKAVSLTSPGKLSKILENSRTRPPLTQAWRFHLTHQEARSRRLIVEGYAYPPYERPYHDELVFYAVLGPDYLSFETSRDFDGDRLLAYLTDRWGPPAEPPRIQVGGRQDEEEGALLLVEWRFPQDRKPEMLRRLGDILGHDLNQ